MAPSLHLPCFDWGGLIIINVYGQIVTPYERPDEANPVSAAIEEIDRAWEQYQQGGSDRREFLQRATQAYAEGIEYIWPKHQARVALTDNWLLWGMGYLDGVVTKLGLTNVDGLLRAYESIDYRRALARGHGICSQNSLGLASLLERRYGIEGDVIGLSGHVVVEAKGYLLDPSVGLAFPFSLAEAERREEEGREISGIYAAAFDSDEATRVYGFDGELESATPFSELGQFYDAEGNQRVEGVRGYRPKLYWVERASDWVKWIVPALILLVGSAGLLVARRQSRIAPA